jgi:hypothetical protein
MVALRRYRRRKSDPSYFPQVVKTSVVTHTYDSSLLLRQLEHCGVGLM